MGVYLQTPKKDKEISRNSNDKVEYLSIGMQGLYYFQIIAIYLLRLAHYNKTAKLLHFS